jgi:hypothetical protein
VRYNYALVGHSAVPPSGLDFAIQILTKTPYDPPHSTFSGEEPAFSWPFLRAFS